MTNRSNNIGAKNNYFIIPPSNFTFVEDSICRCSSSTSISRSNIAFFNTISVGCVIHVAGRTVDPVLSHYCEEKSILIKTLTEEGKAPILHDLEKFDLWIANCITQLLLHSTNGVTLIIGNTETYFDCLVIACLRRVQNWSIVSILAEFRHNIWPHRMLDYEQFIEQFNVDLVDKNIELPEFLSIHLHYKEEELKLLTRCENRILGIKNPETIENSQSPENTIKTTNPEEQEKIDNILNKLFFSKKNCLLSEGITVDPTLSLINDKDDED